ncbi:[protein-PII] uridylyltransferase [Desulfohalobiaceae bacterium Ax17]|uniref:[protein-PII] uridylyltransferase n=1 Tax=Desulfovulcanus ferrireducens TaxID=2831190 RepID=UPI00207BB78C|nr:[protein-PII] uridylyltransferase [Desulfovulcanus ferrireducens]MBT8763966.1 [protein-PII] uridylyltransferase [Desulfovulcanus ferrireducens]
MCNAITRLVRFRDEIDHPVLNKIGGKGFVHKYAQAVDDYFKDRLAEIHPSTSQLPNLLTSSFALVAVGGYGRSELCPGSDIDVLILFAEDIPVEAEDLARDLFHPLWDAGLDLGHGVRSVKECLALSRKNLDVFTSLLDMRFLAGDREIFSQLHTLVQNELVPELKSRFIEWLKEKYEQRRKQLGDASAMIEPHLKEGLGGLRDYHYILWLARVHFALRENDELVKHGLLSHPEYEALQTHLDFLFLVRSHLHLLTGRRTDLLHFELQPDLALKLGFKDQRGKFGVESFLSRLHREMTSLKVLCRLFLHTYFSAKTELFSYSDGQLALPQEFKFDGRKLSFQTPEAILSNNLLILEIFKQSALLGAPLSWETRRLIGQLVPMTMTSLQSHVHAGQRFLDILLSQKADFALEQMLETGFLGSFIPEFGLVQDQVQFDAYHTYPVGQHSVKTVSFLCNFARDDEDFLSEYLSDYVADAALRLAALLHDIGKGQKGHARVGAKLARKILARLRIDEAIIAQTAFLIEHHLLLIKTATRQDLEDESVIINLASQIGSVHRLALLTLLSYADSKATGPKAWNPWVEALLKEIFFKVRKILEQGSLASPHAAHKMATTRDRLRSLAKNDFDFEQLEELLDALPSRYLLHFSPETIHAHLLLIKRLFQEGKANSFKGGCKGFILDAHENSQARCWELTVVSYDEPGLFMNIAGVLALNNINILSADLNVFKNDIVVNVFRVSNPPDPLFAGEFWDKVAHDLKRVMTGRLSLDYRLSLKKQKSDYLQRVEIPEYKPEVIIDNNSSDFYTVIEVIANDRVGLLYDIGATLLNLRLDIVFAKLATHKDQVADIFYVLNVEREKILDPEQEQEIRMALMQRLTS